MANSRNKFDWIMLGSLLGLMIIGISLVYSATVGEPGAYWQKQMIYFLVGIILIAGLQFIPSRLLHVLAWPAYILSLIPLLHVALFRSGDVERWINLPGGLKLQPSEFAKLAVLLVLAHYLSSHKVSLTNFKSLIPVGILFFIPFILVLKQPDLSTALVFSVMVLTMMYWSGMPLWQIFVLVSPLLSVLLTSNNFLWSVLFIILFLVMWLNRVHLFMLLITLLSNMAAGFCSIFLWNKILKEHQRDRILTFIDPMRDPQGSGYQIIQSKVATGSGGFLGKGFGEGTQTNLSFLPEEHTDFIFSVLGEQFGFAGCFLVIVLYFILIARILHSTRELRHGFSSMLVAGIASILTFHIFINIAMTLGMMPVTGLPLPFLSYGGSFVVTCMLLIGIVLNLQVRQEEI